MAARRSSVNPSWIGSGFSHHSVPSLSKVAMRSAGAPKSRPPSVVTRSTKSRMAARAGVSFQDASGSSGMAGIVRPRLELRRPAALQRVEDQIQPPLELGGVVVAGLLQLRGHLEEVG